MCCEPLCERCVCSAAKVVVFLRVRWSDTQASGDVRSCSGWQRMEIGCAAGSAVCCHCYVLSTGRTPTRCCTAALHRRVNCTAHSPLRYRLDVPALLLHSSCRRFDLSLPARGQPLSHRRPTLLCSAAAIAEARSTHSARVSAASELSHTAPTARAVAPRCRIETKPYTVNVSTTTSVQRLITNG